MINRLKFNRRSLFRGLIAAPAVVAAGTEIAKSAVAGSIKKVEPKTVNNLKQGITFVNTCYTYASNVYLQTTTVSLSPECSITISKDVPFTVSPGNITVGKLLE